MRTTRFTFFLICSMRKADTPPMAIIFQNLYKNRAHPCVIRATFSRPVRARLDSKVPVLFANILAVVIDTLLTLALSDLAPSLTALSFPHSAAPG